MIYRKKRVTKIFEKRICTSCGKEFIKSVGNQKMCAECIERDRHRICPICGKEFDTKKGHQKTCSLDCRLVYIKMSKARIYQSKKDVDKIVEIKDVAKTFEVGNCKMCGRRARLRDGFCSKLCKTKWTVENDGLGELLTEDAIWHIQKWHFVDGDSIEKLAEVYQVPREVIAAALRQETPERWSSWKSFYVENRVWRDGSVRLG